MFGWIIIILLALASVILTSISPAYRKLSVTKKPEGLLVQGWPAQILGLASLWIGAFMIYAASHFFGGLGSVHYVFPNWIMLTIGFSMALMSFVMGFSILRHWGEYDDWGVCWHTLLGKKTYAWSEMTGWHQKENTIFIEFKKKTFRFHGGWIGHEELLRWLENKERHLAARRPDGVLVSVSSFGKI